ncbi:flagellar motor protein MotD [Polynucleobacter sp. SHI8]|uniref:OmpA family protein n=1 Tax=unclassified Polynucleobacter TaxID=2640945 RepID=UPI00249075C7|nr:MULTISPECIES: OmpA family protein [unclassified Polynucleobacter]BDW11788.1 flagellar motor protein MotD [Polynucleobacter sp. SHI2]BDW14235.1 flagellar motor protein MotD [Polynucleobacter sp. SHI8]
MKNNLRRRSNPIDDEDDDANRWLLPYADFITLLLAVFVVMYSVSNVEESKFKSLSESLSIALNVKNTESKNNNFISDKTNSMIEQIHTRESQISEINTTLQNDLAPLIAQNKIKIIKVRDGISIVINDSFLFKSGQAQIDPSFEKDLLQISDILKKYPNQIQVEGHTDNNRINTGMYPSNWELSSARASSVVRAFISYGVQESQLTAIGYAANQPIESNNSEEGRYRNRRVAIKILAGIKESP